MSPSANHNPLDKNKSVLCCRHTLLGPLAVLEGPPLLAQLTFPIPEHVTVQPEERVPKAISLIEFALLMQEPTQLDLKSLQLIRTNLYHVPLSSLGSWSS